MLTALTPLILATALAATPGTQGPRDTVPPLFEANSGQWPEETLFLVRGRSGSLHLQRDGLALVRREEDRVATVRLAFDGGRLTHPVGEGASFASTHLLRSGVRRTHTHTRVRYPELWPGVDLVVRSAEGGFEYDLELAPGADLGAAGLVVEGACNLRVLPDGRVLMDTPLGPLTQRPPISWELGADGQKLPLSSGCQAEADTISFYVEGRRGENALVFDPVIDWATHLGGLDYDSANTSQISEDGIVYVGGSTSSPDFPSTPGSFEVTRPTELDAFVAAFDPSATGGSQLLWSTFLAGSQYDEVLDMVLEPTGSLVLVGVTGSADLPSTPGSFAPTAPGGGDAFVARLSGDGTSLLYLSYYGGSGYEWAAGCGLDAGGAVVFGGYTSSNDLPLAGHVIDGTLGGFQDAFVATLLPGAGGAAELFQSTYLGGGGDESVWDASLVCDGTLWLSGSTTSSDLPVTPGAAQTSYAGGFGDAFAAAVNSGGHLAYATYLGGKGEDVAWSVDTRPDGSVVLGGKTLSGDFPTTAGSFDQTPASYTSAWIANLDPRGGGQQDLAYSTLFHGNTWTEFYRVAALPGGLLVGAGFNDGAIPTTPDAAQPSYGGGFDDQVVVFAPDGAGRQDLLYSTYLGGAGAEGTFGLTFRAPWLTLCGRTKSPSDFPATPGAFDPTYGGGSQDGIVARYDLATPGPKVTCSAKTNSLGKEATLAWIGNPSASGADDFVLLGADMVPERFAVACLSSSPGSGTWFGGARCVGDPFVRFGVQRTGCDGTFAARITQSALAQAGFSAGTTLHAQVIYRDTGLPTPTVATSDSLVFTLVP